MCRRATCVALGLVWLGSVAVPLAQTQTLDRILAIAAGYVIMHSDVRAFIDLKLVDVTEDAEPEATTLTRLIERWLILDQVDRYLVADPPAVIIERQLTDVRTSFSSEAAFIRALEQVGYTTDDLRQVLRDNARRDAYLEDRFAAVRLPSDDQLREYFDAHEDELTQSGRPLTFAEARPFVLQRLAGDLRTGMIADWVEGLVRGAVVVRMPIAPDR